jgi:hypothetical protein
MLTPSFEDKGFNYKINKIKFTINWGILHEFYKIINSKALSERIYMSQSLFAQLYKKHQKNFPSQAKRILKGVQQVGRELAEIRFLL